MRLLRMNFPDSGGFWFNENYSVWSQIESDPNKWDDDRWISSYFDFNGEIRSANFIILPIHSSILNHWSLLIIIPHEKTGHVYDSNSNSLARLENFDTIKQWFNGLTKKVFDEESWNLISENSIYQPSRSVACGLYVLLNLRTFLAERYNQRFSVNIKNSVEYIKHMQNILSLELLCSNLLDIRHI